MTISQYMNQIPFGESSTCIKTSLEFEEKVTRYMFNKYGPKSPLIDMMLEMRLNLKPFPV